MKNVFITGMNKNQVTRDYFKQQQLKVVPCHYALIRCLEDMGYTVHQKQYEMNDSQKYDECIVFLAGPRQFVAGYFYDGLCAIANNPNCIIAFDDWQTEGIFNSIEKCKNPEELYSKFILNVNNRSLDSITSEEQALHQKAIEIILTKKNRILFCAFAGGDLSKLINYPKELLFSFNPNPYHLNRQPEFGLNDSPKKLRQFNFASLVQSQTKKWLKKQKISWDIKYYGSRSDGQDRVKENEMVNIYARDWGCLMPGYLHAGSGWWRARPLQVADANSILIGDYNEMEVLYGKTSALDIMTNASKIENMSDAELFEFAALQKNLLYSKHPLNKEITREELKCVLSL